MKAFSFISPLLSLVGICLSIYTGYFVIPSLIQDASIVKGEHAKRQFLMDCKELIYPSDTASATGIMNLFCGIKANSNEFFYSSIDESLLILEASLMEDKFLPISHRQNLLLEVEHVKNQIDEQQLGCQSNRVQESSNDEFIIFFIRSLTVILSGGALILVYLYNKKARINREEINDELTSIDAASNEISSSAFENQVSTIVASVSENLINEQNDKSPFDLVYYSKSNRSNIALFLDLKYLTSSKVGLGSVNSFLSKVKGKEGTFVLVHNTELTPRAKSKLQEFQSILNSPTRVIESIHFKNESQFYEVIKLLLDRHGL